MIHKKTLVLKQVFLLIIRISSVSRLTWQQNFGQSIYACSFNQVNITWIACSLTYFFEVPSSVCSTCQLLKFEINCPLMCMFVSFVGLYSEEITDDTFRSETRSEQTQVSICTLKTCQVASLEVSEAWSLSDGYETSVPGYLSR
jgi:hypothetical protein